MLVSLSEVMNCRDEETKLNVPVEFDVFRRKGAEYPVLGKPEISFSLVSHSAKKVLVRAFGKVVLSVPCDRCLKEVELPFDINFEQEIDFSETRGQQTEDLEELAYISGYDLDTDLLVFEELLVAFPGKILCREDCKGICEVCGKNQNDGECGCDRTVLDPRMAAIWDIFKEG